MRNYEKVKARVILDTKIGNNKKEIIKDFEYFMLNNDFDSFCESLKLFKIDQYNKTNKTFSIKRRNKKY